MRASAWILLAAMVTACGASRPPLAPAGPPVSEETPVRVYGATWCRYTRSALDWFRARRIPVVFRDVDTNSDAWDEMTRTARERNVEVRGIPVLDVRGRILLGFHAEDVERALQD